MVAGYVSLLYLFSILTPMYEGFFLLVVVTVTGANCFLDIAESMHKKKSLPTFFVRFLIQAKPPYSLRNILD